LLILISYILLYCLKVEHGILVVFWNLQVLALHDLYTYFIYFFYKFKQNKVYALIKIWIKYIKKSYIVYIFIYIEGLVLNFVNNFGEQGIVILLLFFG